MNKNREYVFPSLRIERKSSSSSKVIKLQLAFTLVMPENNLPVDWLRPNEMIQRRSLRSSEIPKGLYKAPCWLKNIREAKIFSKYRNQLISEYEAGKFVWAAVDRRLSLFLSIHPTDPFGLIAHFKIDPLHAIQINQFPEWYRPRKDIQQLISDIRAGIPEVHPPRPNLIVYKLDAVAKRKTLKLLRQKKQLMLLKGQKPAYLQRLPKKRSPNLPSSYVPPTLAELKGIYDTKRRAYLDTITNTALSTGRRTQRSLAELSGTFAALAKGLKKRHSILLKARKGSSVISRRLAKLVKTRKGSSPITPLEKSKEKAANKKTSAVKPAKRIIARKISTDLTTKNEKKITTKTKLAPRKTLTKAKANSIIKTATICPSLQERAKFKPLAEKVTRLKPERQKLLSPLDVLFTSPEIKPKPEPSRKTPAFTISGKRPETIKVPKLALSPPWKVSTNLRTGAPTEAKSSNNSKQKTSPLQQLGTKKGQFIKKELHEKVKKSIVLETSKLVSVNTKKRTSQSIILELFPTSDSTPSQPIDRNRSTEYQELTKPPPITASPQRERDTTLSKPNPKLELINLIDSKRDIPTVEKKTKKHNTNLPSKKSDKPSEKGNRAKRVITGIPLKQAEAISLIPSVNESTDLQQKILPYDKTSTEKAKGLNNRIGESKEPELPISLLSLSPPVSPGPRILSLNSSAIASLMSTPKRFLKLPALTLSPPSGASTESLPCSKTRPEASLSVTSFSLSPGEQRKHITPKVKIISQLSEEPPAIKSEIVEKNKVPSEERSSSQSFILEKVSNGSVLTSRNESWKDNKGITTRMPRNFHQQNPGRIRKRRWVREHCEKSIQRDDSNPERKLPPKPFLIGSNKVTSSNPYRNKARRMQPQPCYSEPPREREYRNQSTSNSPIKQKRQSKKGGKRKRSLTPYHKDRKKHRSSVDSPLRHIRSITPQKSSVNILSRSTTPKKWTGRRKERSWTPPRPLQIPSDHFVTPAQQKRKRSRTPYYADRKRVKINVSDIQTSSEDRAILTRSPKDYTRKVEIRTKSPRSKNSIVFAPHTPRKENWPRIQTPHPIKEKRQYTKASNVDQQERRQVTEEKNYRHKTGGWKRSKTVRPVRGQKDWSRSPSIGVNWLFTLDKNKSFEGASEYSPKHRRISKRDRRALFKSSKNSHSSSPRKSRTYSSSSASRRSSRRSSANHRSGCSRELSTSPSVRPYKIPSSAKRRSSPSPKHRKRKRRLSISAEAYRRSKTSYNTTRTWSTSCSVSNSPSPCQSVAEWKRSKNPKRSSEPAKKPIDNCEKSNLEDKQMSISVSPRESRSRRQLPSKCTLTRSPKPHHRRKRNLQMKLAEIRKKMNGSTFLLYGDTLNNK